VPAHLLALISRRDTAWSGTVLPRDDPFRGNSFPVRHGPQRFLLWCAIASLTSSTTVGRLISLISSYLGHDPLCVMLAARLVVMRRGATLGWLCGHFGHDGQGRCAHSQGKGV